MSKILYNISTEEFRNRLNILENNEIIIIRFTAEWCKPCQEINQECNDFFENCNQKIFPIIIDIDESIDLYITMKRYKMVNGIPALLAFYGNDQKDKKDHWYIPSNSVIGSNKKNLSLFFKTCEMNII